MQPRLFFLLWLLATIDEEWSLMGQGEASERAWSIGPAQLIAGRSLLKQTRKFHSFNLQHDP